jgi:hypothetical protein
MMLKWSDIGLPVKMPKIHGLEDHLIASMEQWNGTGDFREDFIEQAHDQLGMTKEEKRTATMRDRVRASNSHSKWEQADKMSSDVCIAKEEVKEKTSRKPEMNSH